MPTEATDDTIKASELPSFKVRPSPHALRNADALFAGPVARFGDTAANAGILALLESNPILSKMPSHIQSIFASLCAAMFRMVLTPIDTLKTTLQAQGKPGWEILRQRIKVYGLGSLWYGAVATAAATFVGHYPWFSTVSFPLSRPFFELPVRIECVPNRFIIVQFPSEDSTRCEWNSSETRSTGHHWVLCFSDLRYRIELSACREDLSPSKHLIMRSRITSCHMLC